MPQTVELYLRDEGDPLYNPQRLETDQELEMLLGQLKMIMSTSRGTVLGDPGFGLNLEKLLFLPTVNNEELRQQLRRQVDKYCPLAQRYEVDFEIKFLKPTANNSRRDSVLIDVSINRRPVLGFYY